MIKLLLYDIKKYLCILIIIIASITGLLKFFWGSFVAEVGILVFSFLFCLLLLKEKKEYMILDYIFIGVVIYSFFITFINILVDHVNIKCLFGFYYYSIPCLIFINRDNIFKKNFADKYFKIFLIMLTINSIYAIYQTYINPMAIVPLDPVGRATGLMKATLNYSGIIGATFIPLLCIKVKNRMFKMICLILITIGGLLTLSRGLIANICSGFLLSYPLQILIYKRISLRMIYKLLKYLAYFIASVFILYIILLKLGFFEQFSRLFSIIDYSNDPANRIRANIWSHFTPYFIHNPFGYGIGRLKSGTSYIENSITFESYILNSIYSIGLIATILYFVTPILWMYKKLKNENSYTQQIVIMYVSGILVQNLIQPSMITPTTLVITWFNMIFFTHYLITLNNRDTQPTFLIKTRRNIYG